MRCGEEAGNERSSEERSDKRCGVDAGSCYKGR